MAKSVITKEELELSKLQTELEILKINLKLERTKVNQTTTKLPISTAFKNWTAIVLGIIAVPAAIWGLFGPVSDYLEEQKKRLTHELSDNMIRFVDSLRSDEDRVRDDALIMLMYYEKNALPILYYKLEKSNMQDGIYHVDQVVDAINGIYNTNPKGVLKDLLKRYTTIYDNLFKYNNAIGAEDLNILLYDAVINYTYLLGKLEFTGKDQKVTKEFLIKMNKTITNESDNRKEHMGAYIDEISKTLRILGCQDQPDQEIDNQS
ncbi:MAG: hypothetical protein KAR19_18585 [Bacteroidales bacterium]|nr:hypothetical protein [Bacteroidales bacterium]